MHARWYSCLWPHAHSNLSTRCHQMQHAGTRSVNACSRAKNSSTLFFSLLPRPSRLPQVNPDKYKGLVKGLRLIMAEEGSRAIWKGWLPTFFGYSAQGAFKYGLYEIFKDQYANMLGKENFEKYKGLVWCAASASAEVFADLALCPLEMVKVKVQTSPHGTFPTAFGPAWAQMSAKRAETGFPYRSLVPLWSRQVPYTVAKFFFFEKVR
jgi:solute carrier family 25 (mitochondrial phosphate transporter), member 3